MRSKSFYSVRQHSRSSALGGWLLAILLTAPAASAAAPEWLRAAAREQVPAYDSKTVAVVVYDEQVVTIDDKGEIKAIYRRALRILRPEGRSLGRISVHFDLETKLTYLKAWSIPPQGKEYEVKEKDAVEIGEFEDLYSDTRRKVLTIPAAEPGHVIGFEYEQKQRPYLLQTTWWFQDFLPVRKARFLLNLPTSWEFTHDWVNHPPVEPRSAGANSWVWEVSALDAAKDEPQMPPPHAIMSRMTVNYLPPDPVLRAKALGTWEQLGRFYDGLTSGRRQATPDIQAKVKEVTSPATTAMARLQSLAAFAQRDIRYVAIEIGIGGWQPHAASDVFSRRYGDCKDKVTLLSTMLREAGIASYYVLVHTERGVVTPQYPPAMTFNHVILAVALPDDVAEQSLFAVQHHPRLGRLLYFDPTDDMTPLGHLPTHLQASHGLLVSDAGGELVGLPMQAPTTNRLIRMGKMELSAAGKLTGEVQEIRWGALAADRRAEFLTSQETDRQKVLEGFLGSFLGGFLLSSASVENLEARDQNLILRYRFVADNYAKRAGNLVLIRPRVLGQKSRDVMEGEERTYPVEFEAPSLETDTFEIKLPAGFRLEELPAPVEIDLGFAEYRSKTELQGDVLRYHRDFKVKDVRVPKERLPELKRFFRLIAGDERANAVLQLRH